MENCPETHKTCALPQPDQQLEARDGVPDERLEGRRHDDLQAARLRRAPPATVWPSFRDENRLVCYCSPFPQAEIDALYPLVCVVVPRDLLAHDLLNRAHK